VLLLLRSVLLGAYVLYGRSLLWCAGLRLLLRYAACAVSSAYAVSGALTVLGCALRALVLLRVAFALRLLLRSLYLCGLRRGGCVLRFRVVGALRLRFVACCAACSTVAVWYDALLRLRVCCVHVLLRMQVEVTSGWGCGVPGLVVG
jgi:hypothetical protein